MSKIQYETDGDVAVIILNDPPLNVFGEQHWDEMIAAVGKAAAAGHRALLIRAEGPNFSGGAEVEIFHKRGAEEARSILARYLTISHTLENLPFPVIAAVRGLCLASGLELALACDLILAGESARFSQSEAVIGAATFLGGAQRLARRCGDARAREIVYTADVFDAATFERWNIINRIFPDDALDREALALAKRLAAGPTRAHAVTKHLVRTFNAKGLEAADEEILTEAVKLWDSRDMQSAVEQVLNVERAKIRSLGISFSGR
jgi:enoyl-CoA hydratase/carnithine racemase